jgi:hypothetical protein
MDVHSDDDSDSEGKSRDYTCRPPVWRADAFGELLHDVDELVALEEGTPIGRRKRRGNIPRKRLESETPDESRVVPVGLPINCYDIKWLKNTTRLERAMLETTKELDFRVVKEYKEAAEMEEE